MLKYLSSIGASTAFEKNRLEITGKNLDAPSETSLRAIIATFSGEDNQTRSQIAFATIIKKMLSSDSKDNWIYQLKNLIVFDRVVEQHLFNEQISVLSLPIIENFKESDAKSYQCEPSKILKSFWHLIREKSNAIVSSKHIFSSRRSQRTDFLAKLDSQALLNQLSSIENFFVWTFELIQLIQGSSDTQNQGKNSLAHSGLGTYLWLQILHRLMLYYACQMQINTQFIDKIVKGKPVEEQELKRFKKHVLKFKVNANEYIKFVEQRKHIKGFEEVNYKELNPFHNIDMAKLIDEYILEKKSTSSSPQFTQQIYLPEEITIKMKPNYNREIMKQRTKYQLSEQIGEADPFNDWINSYSADFPQKEVMTIDLIQQIRKEEKNLVQEEMEPKIYGSSRDSVILDCRKPNNYQLVFASPSSSPSGPPAFTNIYSKLEPVWNQ